MTARHINSELQIKNYELKLGNCHCEKFRQQANDEAISTTDIILALGSEFDTRLALFIDNKIYFSENTGEIAKNPEDLEKFILEFLSSVILPSSSPFGKGGRGDFKNIIPNIIITDLHPLYNSTQIGEKLAKRWHITHYKLQHHLAHIFTAFGDYLTSYKLQVTSYKNIVGIACDGTGYGLDDKIWGGEVIKYICHSELVSESRNKQSITRIGHLEEQTLIGGDLSIEEPARMLISLLSKIYSKKDIFPFIKKYYSKKNFEVIYSQLAQNFNCQQTTSASRILDAASILLGFCKNTREYKHYPAKMIEKNSLPTTKYLEPKIQINNSGEKILETTRLIKYIISQLHCHPEHLECHSELVSESPVGLSLREGYCRRGNLKILKQVQNDTKHEELAALSQTYIIDGLYQIAKTHCHPKNNLPIFLSGGLADNKIFRDFAAQHNIYIPQKFSPGDDSIAAGQIFWYLLN